MKKIGILLLAALSLSGCASMYQGMGLATAEDLSARDQRIDSLETQFRDVSAKVSETAANAQKIAEESKLVATKAAEVEALMKDLQGRVDQLPQETLKRLAEILTKAAQEAPPSGTKP